MANNIRSNDPEGKVTVTLPSNYVRNVKAGELVVIGQLVGIAVRNAAKGQEVTLVTRGVASITADAGATVGNTKVGAIAYAEQATSSSAALATADKAGHVRIGVFVRPGTAGNQVEVALNVGAPPNP